MSARKKSPVKLGENTINVNTYYSELKMFESADKGVYSSNGASPFEETNPTMEKTPYESNQGRTTDFNSGERDPNIQTANFGSSRREDSGVKPPRAPNRSGSPHSVRGREKVKRSNSRKRIYTEGDELRHYDAIRPF